MDIMTSATEAKIAGSFVNGQEEVIPLHVTLNKLGHRQPPTPMQTTNSTATGFTN
jgi:hypothetical protein